MLLDLKAIEWELKIGQEARRHGWIVYEHTLRQRKPYDPSMVLTRLDELIVVYARTSAPRAGRTPPLERFPGAEVVLWCRADWASVRAALARPPRLAEQG
ncbi:hypothetical protein AB0K48_06315 [Nonomuraea sp. NPDC055795]